MMIERFQALGRHVVIRAMPWLLCLAIWAARAVSAQAIAGDSAPKRSALAGVVRDTVGRPIQFATVFVEGKDLSAVSDDSGRFHLAGLPSGPTEFTVMRLGYLPLSFATVLAPDSTLVIAVQLRSVQTLETVDVTAGRLSPGLVRSGFYERRRTGLGSYLTPARIDSLWHVTRSSQYLRDVRGIELVCRPGGCSVQTRLPPNCLWVFIDGVPAAGQIDDLLAPGAVAAIEVYERPSIVPTEFQARRPMKTSTFTVQAGCGALVVWTKARAG